jgi:hypothetical protein
VLDAVEEVAGAVVAAGALLVSVLVALESPDVLVSLVVLEVSFEDDFDPRLSFL